MMGALGAGDGCSGRGTPGPGSQRAFFYLVKNRLEMDFENSRDALIPH
jgi:hypothetical protein